MREDFMKARPDIVEAWLKTELEAQQFVLDPKNAAKVAEYVKDQTAGHHRAHGVVLFVRPDSRERRRQPDSR